MISPEGTQLGVLPTAKALALAQQFNLDLVEVAPNANPPVCRIMDFGKYVYEEQKKQNHVKSTASKIKEIELTARIAPNDFMTKIRHAEGFLDEGSKVKVRLEVPRPRAGASRARFGVVKRAIDEPCGMGHPDSEPASGQAHQLDDFAAAGEQAEAEVFCPRGTTRCAEAPSRVNSRWSPDAVRRVVPYLAGACWALVICAAADVSAAPLSRPSRPGERPAAVRPSSSSLFCCGVGRSRGGRKQTRLVGQAKQGRRDDGCDGVRPTARIDTSVA